MLKPTLTTLATGLALTAGLILTDALLTSLPAQAQISNTLRDPLVPGALSTPPFVCAPDGPAEAPGQGPTPQPVTPGMGGLPGALPWVPNIPADTIGIGSSGIPLPVSPPIVSLPGVLGPSLTPFIPPPPSTPGPDPGPMTAPYGSFNPAEMVQVNPGGGLPGTGGYYTSIPTERRGGQQTHEWDYRERHSVLGGGGDSQDEVTRLGPVAGYGVPYGVPTGDGARHSAIDLGGGMRIRAGDCKLPLGTSVQDYGLSALRGNGTLGLDANQSYEFGQGWRRIPIYSSTTTDFGFPYRQFNPANVAPQATGQYLAPYAIETNF